MTDYASLSRDELIERLKALERRDPGEDKALQTETATEEKYRALFGNMVEEVHFWKVVRDGSGVIRNWRLVDINPAAERSWGKRRQDVIGKNADQIFSTALETFMPIVQNIFHTGKPHTWETYFPDLRQHMKMSSVAFGDYFFTTGFDVTDIKTSQLRQEKLGVMARLATEATDIGVWELDLQTGHLTWNEQMLKIYGTNALYLTHTVQDWVDRIHPDEREELTTKIHQCMETGANFDGIFRILTPSGETRIVRSRSEIIKNEINATPFMIGTNMDITEQQKMIEDLKESREIATKSSNAKSAFLASMSHELRTPMNAVLGYSQMLKLMANDRLNDKDKEYIGYILESGEHLLALINDILDLSLVETQNYEIEKEYIDITDVIIQAEQMIRPLSDKKQVLIERTPAPEAVPPIWTSRIRLNQILLNLLSNAVKYSPVGSKVTISTQMVALGRIRFSVADQGCGIAPEDQAMIFSPFTRLHKNPMTSAEGAGIGLAVSKKLAEQLGGAIGVDSEVGVGSTFWVEFPCGPEQ